MILSANEGTLGQVLLDPPDYIFPQGMDFYDVPPRRLLDFVRVTGLAVGEVSDALDSLIAKSVLDQRHGPADFIKLGETPPDDEIGGVWYGISANECAKAAYDIVRERNLRKKVDSMLKVLPVREEDEV